MSISFYAGKQIGDSITWVFTNEELTERFYKDRLDYEDDGEANPAYRPELDINMSNRNAAYVLFQLGIALEDGFFKVPIDEMIKRCTRLLKSSMRQKKQGLLTTVQQLPGKVTMIDCGLPEGYVEQQVMRISILAREGKARGAELIYGC